MINTLLKIEVAHDKLKKKIKSNYLIDKTRKQLCTGILLLNDDDDDDIPVVLQLYEVCGCDVYRITIV